MRAPHTCMYVMCTRAKLLYFSFVRFCSFAYLLAGFSRQKWLLFTLDVNKCSFECFILFDSRVNILKMKKNVFFFI